MLDTEDKWLAYLVKESEKHIAHMRKCSPDMRAFQLPIGPEFHAKALVQRVRAHYEALGYKVSMRQDRFLWIEEVA